MPVEAVHVSRAPDSIVAFSQRIRPSHAKSDRSIGLLSSVTRISPAGDSIQLQDRVDPIDLAEGLIATSEPVTVSLTARRSIAYPSRSTLAPLMSNDGGFMKLFAHSEQTIVRGVGHADQPRPLPHRHQPGPSQRVQGEPLGCLKRSGRSFAQLMILL